MVAKRLFLNVEYKNTTEQYKCRALFITTLMILNKMIVDYRVECIMSLLKLKAEMIDTQDSSLTDSSFAFTGPADIAFIRMLYSCSNAREENCQKCQLD